jgi:hypothetical protein
MVIKIDDEAKLIKEDIKKNWDLMKGFNNTPSLAVPYIENIIILYNKLYNIQKPTVSDKIGFNMLKTQYKTMCLLSRKQINKSIL